MSYAFALVPNFSVPVAVPPVRLDPARCAADPIFAAIERHTLAWAAYQTAPEGEASEEADDECDAARDALLGTACVTRAGAFALLWHLRWWLAEEAVNAGCYELTWPMVLAREAEVTMLLGAAAAHRIPLSLPDGVAVGAIPRPARPGVSALRPSLARSLFRLGRAVLASGETAAALVLIVGGCIAIGWASCL